MLGGSLITLEKEAADWRDGYQVILVLSYHELSACPSHCQQKCLPWAKCLPTHPLGGECFTSSGFASAESRRTSLFREYLPLTRGS
jgi:hypothetical protein